ncbi:hypothetical protein [Ferrimonas marina]|uniref:Uncharacterized protein n=1 Tax=Ferrimonas marina TaxID=299255 RepID=A0A1M5U7Y1_9GAMM|nr:hypothetical protein [Ferrimonas marina]SHH59152.1 hypothetical protein SAMN02745129_2448 [Ferrimonas marina]
MNITTLTQLLHTTIEGLGKPVPNPAIKAWPLGYPKALKAIPTCGARNVLTSLKHCSDAEQKSVPELVSDMLINAMHYVSLDADESDYEPDEDLAERFALGMADYAPKLQDSEHAVRDYCHGLLRLASQYKPDKAALQAQVAAATVNFENEAQPDG